MSRHIVLQNIKRSSLFTYALLLVLSTLLPVILSRPAGAAQLGDRFIDMSATQTSEGSGRDGGDSFGQDVTYSVSFDVTTTGNIEGIVIDFCDSPLVGTTCNAPAGFDTNEAGPLAVSAGASPLTLNAATDANTVVLADTSGTGIAATGGVTTVAFDLGSSAVGDGITNPTSAGSFYARIITYTDDTVAVAYTDTSPGAYTDEGGIALAVANELTVTARVQEVLEFCIGTDEDSWSAINANTAGFETNDSCTQISGTDLDLGVITSSIETTSDADAVADALLPDEWNTGNDGVLMIRTNAVNGATIYYKAEQDTGSNPSGHLKLANGDCSASANPTFSLADNCFNSAGTTQGILGSISGAEGFGMTLTNLNTTAGGATTALSCDAQYDGNGSCGNAAASEGHAWLDTGAFDTIASSGGPLDDEMANVEFAAIAAPTTPTGIYTVTANFVATSTF